MLLNFNFILDWTFQWVFPLLYSSLYYGFTQCYIYKLYICTYIQWHIYVCTDSVNLTIVLLPKTKLSAKVLWVYGNCYRGLALNCQQSHKVTTTTHKNLEAVHVALFWTASRNTMSVWRVYIKLPLPMYIYNVIFYVA